MVVRQYLVAKSSTLNGTRTMTDDMMTPRAALKTISAPISCARLCGGGARD